MIQLDPTPDGGLALAGHATIDHAAALRDGLLALVDRLAPGAPLDLAGLEGLDVAGVQLLLALRRRVPLRATGLSPSLHERLEAAALAAPLLAPEAP